MLGAMATSSVSASRQAEGGGGTGAAAVGRLVRLGGRLLVRRRRGGPGASAGRGLGSGTDAGSKDPRSFGRRFPNSSPHRSGAGLAGRAAAVRPARKTSAARRQR